LLAASNTIEMNRNGSPSGPLDRALACFSVRFPLGFNFAYRDTRSIVGNQIKSHMWLCTVITNGFKILLTTVGSEPLLAEAATQAMATIKTSPVKLLSNYLGTNCISVGERGELVAALLVMRARDVTYWQCRLVGGSSVAGAAIRARCPPSPPGSAVLCHTRSGSVARRRVGAFGAFGAFGHEEG